ncbi:helix-turn-helix transcriptional regulator [Arundinibacter roseus]|uniref:YafY family transcriptional regulator n=1 Tax=Arundinibacter roseus TaxID=2070510 RepID=A0A4R4KJS2_9BACT|nr:YafY family protein [Arundinibacter roseus]TDB66771.1 YafY family transcriptional regulator [Arundinibacter roseus]
MNRLDRLTALLIHLQSKRIVKAQEIADRFEVSLRTVYRDIRTLELAGVPLLGEAGVGYSLVTGYRLPPVHFTRGEALSFVTAGKLVQALTDETTKTAFQSALYKIKAVLPATEKELVETVSSHIEVLDNPYLPQKRNQNLNIERILNSITRKQVIQLSYISAANTEVSFRIVEPVGIYSRGPYWYLIAFCRLRNAYRNFRIDRVQSLESLSDHFSTTHPSLHSFIEETSREKVLHKVILRIDKSAVHYLGDQHFYHGFVSQDEIGNQLQMTFLTESLNGLAHWFLLLGEVADIIEPVEIKTLVQQKLDLVKNRLYSKDSKPC